ncbi:hypothetical protein CVT26_002455 [Gymnopilus dilepis]|uniref:MYND-type domain-containing protein n=1 Tax=Gymnopilus dilepis TaxID=231916 RepID=A0A409VT43_9AGAR|nr:hypothetical protein CVT26_002455 [Gymnopilus dilepis]
MSTSSNHLRSYCRLGSHRGYRLCDQCGSVESATLKLKLCGACLTTQYCSRTCQRLHWAYHKTICRHTVALIQQASEDAPKQTIGGQDLVKDLRRFASAYSTLLGWAGFQGLQLTILPHKISEEALLIVLQYRPHVQAHCRFILSATYIVPQTFICDPLVNDEIRRRDERCRLNAGIGAMVVIIQCESTSEVMPFEVDAPQDIDWAICSDWAAVLAESISMGRTDFQPVRVSH